MLYLCQFWRPKFGFQGEFKIKVRLCPACILSILLSGQVIPIHSSWYAQSSHTRLKFHCRREVAPFKAALRTHHFFETAPHASNSSAAANLINYSLHCVTQRMKAHTDRRMTSLNSVSNLVSLQAGNKGQFKYGHKQPVRRRRGDVHEDITTIVAYFDWKGRNVWSAQEDLSRLKIMYGEIFCCLGAI